jgi:hypothetical protein
MSAAVIADAVLDVLAVGEVYARGDHEGAHAVLDAWIGKDGTPLVVASLGLLWRVLGGLDDPQAWLEQVRQAALAGEMP